MIINTGNRTDIPAFFSEWFINRIQAGFVDVRNPYYPKQVTRYELNPEVVDCLCFITKNPGPMLHRLSEIQAYRQFWFVTLTPYGKEIEPHVPKKSQVLENFKSLSNIVGAHKVVWRYDPIFISETYPLERHIQAFEFMASQLCGYTSECVISFIDLYEKTKRNFRGVRAVNWEEQHILALELVAIAQKYGMTLKTCVESEALSKYGIDTSGCMTQRVLERAMGEQLSISKKNTSREGCNCLLGNDIGVYNSCPHACIYCYANYSKDLVSQNLKQHDEHSSFLIGNSLPDDVMKMAKQESYLTKQLTLF